MKRTTPAELAALAARVRAAEANGTNRAFRTKAEADEADTVPAGYADRRSFLRDLATAASKRVAGLN